MLPKRNPSAGRFALMLMITVFVTLPIAVDVATGAPLSEAGVRSSREQGAAGRESTDTLFAVRHSRLRFQTPLAVTHVTIIPEPGTRIENGTIVMEGGRITAVGSGIDIPEHAQRVDGTGLTAYPGFIDASTYLGMADVARTPEERLRAEDENPDPRQGPLAVTREANRRGIRPEFRAVDVYAPDADKLKTHRAGGFTTALITPRVGILEGTSDLVALSNAPIRRAVIASHIAMHASFQTKEEGDYPRTLLGVFAQFRQVMLDAGWYARMQKYTERHPLNSERTPRDRALEALQPLLADRQRIFFEADTGREIRRAVKLAHEFNLNVVVTGAREAWKVADLLKAEHIPLIVSLKFDDEPEYGKKKGNKRPKQPPGVAGDEPDRKPQKRGDKKKTIYEPLKLRKERRRLWEEQVANVIRLTEAGIPFSLRTRDFDKPDEFWKNVRLVTQRGLSETALVAALTRQPADLFGLSQQLGSIQPGQLANLTLTDRSVTDEKAKVKMVFIDGERFEIQKETGKSPDGKPQGKGAQTPKGQAEQSQTGQESSTEAPSEEKGPDFEVEIVADRSPATKTRGDVAIENATIIPVTSPTLDHASIIIRNGKIEAIGQRIEIPANVPRIDGTGRFVMPGMVDAHSHLGIDGVNEWPLAISAEVRIADLINPDSVAIFRAAAGGTTTHHTMHGSANPIGGQNAVWKLKYRHPVEELLIPDAPRTIKFALGENVIQSNRQTAWGKRFPNTRMGVEALMRAAFETARAYQHEWEEYQRQRQAGRDVPPLRRDLRLEALSDVLAGRLTVHSHCYRSDEILRLMQVAEDYGFRIGTLQHVLEGYRIAPEIARHGCGASTFSNFWSYKVEAYGAIPYNAALMTEHGINVSINSDSPNTIRYFGQEAAKCIKWGGLSENEALRLVTINPAMQLQIDHRIGSLEVGKDGDLAIFNGHPLNTFSKCVMTLIDGEVVFEDDRPDPVERCDTFNPPQKVDRTIPETRHRAFAIVGATIHPISGPVIEKGTVVIVEDKIQAVGTDVAVPPGAGVIEAAGLHVYPGMIDAGSTLGLTEIGSLRATRDNREIATFSPNLHVKSAIHPHSKHIRIARTAGITTALVQPSGERIAGQSAVIHLDGWTAPEMVVLDDAGLRMTVPSLPVHLRGDKVAKKKMKKDHEEAVRKLEAFMEKAQHYAKIMEHEPVQGGDAGGVDLRLEAMIPYIRGEKPVIFNAHRYKHILDTIEFAEKYGLKCVISGATQSWKLADILAEKKIPVILGTPLSYPRGRFEPWDSIYRCAAILSEAGVEFCFASQSASGAYNLGIQAGMAVAHGLPRDRAEYALTLGAAKILGIADRVGSIEPEKLADLIVTTDTPLQTVSQVTHMFIAGKPIELTSMHTEEYEKFKHRPEPVLPPPPALVGPPNLTRR